MNRWTVSFLTLTALGGCAKEEKPTFLANRLDPVISAGEVDELHTNVLGLVMEMGGGIGSCTGSLIAPNLVLTAHHCVASVPDGPIFCGRTAFGDVIPASSVFVTTRTEIPFNGQGLLAVREIHVPERNADVCGNDIALLILRNPIPAAVATPLVPRLEDFPARGDRFTAVGYGVDETGRGSGTRHIINNREILCAGQNCGRLGATAKELVGNDGTCQGDSGGPALDAEERVMGALSRGGDGCVFPTYSAVAGWSDWIKEIAVLAADEGGYELPGWVSGDVGPPPPDTDGDGRRDPYDNCPDLPNADQADLDNDGVGDLCDEVDDRDRGGNCAVCNGCDNDSQCGPGGFCADTPSGGLCTIECSGQEDCPDSTACYQVGRNGFAVCLNDDVEQRGFCHPDFVCGGVAIVVPDPEPDASVDPDSDPDAGVTPQPDPDAGPAPAPDAGAPPTNAPDQGALEVVPEFDRAVSSDDGCSAAPGAPATPFGLLAFGLGLVTLRRRGR